MNSVVARQQFMKTLFRPAAQRCYSNYAFSKASSRDYSGRNQADNELFANSPSPAIIRTNGRDYSGRSQSCSQSFNYAESYSTESKVTITRNKTQTPTRGAAATDYSGRDQDASADAANVDDAYGTAAALAAFTNKVHAPTSFYTDAAKVHRQA